jgi:hypothetical protein
MPQLAAIVPAVIVAAGDDRRHDEHHFYFLFNFLVAAFLCALGVAVWSTPMACPSGFETVVCFIAIALSYLTGGFLSFRRSPGPKEGRYVY